MPSMFKGENIMQFIKTFPACFSLAVFVVLGPVTASAASACKGIEKDACEAKDE